MLHQNNDWQIDSQNENLFSINEWGLLRWFSEIKEGFNELANIGDCITIVGSCRVTEGSKFYQMARDTAKLLVKEGFGIITGGGSGIMEAGNRGAVEAGGKSVGILIDLPKEQIPNRYLNIELNFRQFSSVKLMFIKFTKGWIIFPGGIGTLDEFFEVMTIIRSHKIPMFPIILVGNDYWIGMIKWLKKVLSFEEMMLFTLCDEPMKIVERIVDFYR